MYDNKSVKIDTILHQRVLPLCGARQNWLNVFEAVCFIVCSTLRLLQ